MRNTLILLSILLVPCTSSASGNISDILSRTSVDNWCISTIGGFAFEEPSASRGACKSYPNAKGRHLSLHPFKPKGMIADSRYLITISLKIIPYKDFLATRDEKISPRNFLSKNKNYTNWLSWDSSIHLKTSFFNNQEGTYLYYRRDLIDPNKEYVLTASCEYINVVENGEELYFEQDDKIIKKIFDSFRNIE